jgi:nucleoside-diphosphate-sugar epimerase
MKNNPLYIEDINNAKQVQGIEKLHGKRFLITGATGLIGHHLIDVLMTLPGVEVVAVGRNHEKAEKTFGSYFSDSRFSFLEQDVKQPFDASLKVDYIVVGASNTHPMAYSTYPIDTIMTNIMGTKNALDLAVRCGAEVLFPSSTEIYGTSRDNAPFKEGDTGNLDLSKARACYTEAKRVSEALCQSYISEKSAIVKIVRLSRTLGPTMLLSDSKASSQFILKALHNEDIVLKSEGNQYFSYTYVTDAVKALLTVLLHGKVGEAYNVSVDACNIKLKDFAKICANHSKKEVVFDLPDEVERKGYSIAQYSILDNTKLRSIGFVPSYTIEDAIHRTIEILKES